MFGVLFYLVFFPLSRLYCFWIVEVIYLNSLDFPDIWLIKFYNSLFSYLLYFSSDIFMKKQTKLDKFSEIRRNLYRKDLSRSSGREEDHY